MKHAKVVVSLFIIVILALVVVGANETINPSNGTVIIEETPLVILPVEETAAAESTPQDAIAIQPIEESPVITSPVQESAPADAVTGGLVVEPVIQEPTILKTIIELILDKISVIRGQIVQFTASLFFEDGSPAVNKEVTFFAGEETIGTDLTDEAGKATVSWDTTPFGPNVYVISAEYAGENGVAGSSAGKNVVITEVLPAVETTVNESVLTTAAVVEPTAAPSPVEEIQECKTISFQDTEHVYGTCTRNMMRCSGLTNSTCATVEEEYRCETGQQVVTKSYQQCTTTKLRVNNGQKIVEIDLKEYACSNTESGSMITVICDSKYDGNGDGHCSSGESCQQIVVNGTTIQKLEKNSDDEYRADDDSYFMPEVGMVVIQ